MDPPPNLRTGFQAKYLDPFYRKLFLDRAQTIEDEVLNRSNGHANHDPPPEDNIDYTQKLTDLVEKTQKPLLQIRTVIPLNPFPDEIIIDINKVTIIIRYFFFSRHIHSVYVKDISDVIVETGLIFSTLKIVDVGFTENSIDVKYLSTRGAIKARKIIQGLVVAHRNGIDLCKYEFSDLDEQLAQLGKAEEKS